VGSDSAWYKALRWKPSHSCYGPIQRQADVALCAGTPGILSIFRQFRQKLTKRRNLNISNIILSLIRFTTVIKLKYPLESLSQQNESYYDKKIGFLTLLRHFYDYSSCSTTKTTFTTPLRQFIRHSRQLRHSIRQSRQLRHFTTTTTKPTNPTKPTNISTNTTTKPTNISTNSLLLATTKNRSLRNRMR
jgi:hypothetical protein